MAARQQVGIRELKAHLSRHLRRVRAGARLIITDRGKPIAILSPVAEPAADPMAWARQMVAEGLATWGGGKPGFPKPVRLRKRGITASQIVLEDRR